MSGDAVVDNSGGSVAEVEMLGGLLVGKIGNERKCGGKVGFSLESMEVALLLSSVFFVQEVEVVYGGKPGGVGGGAEWGELVYGVPKVAMG